MSKKKDGASRREFLTAGSAFAVMGLAAAGTGVRSLSTCGPWFLMVRPLNF